jgi:hypothetical protein
MYAFIPPHQIIGVPQPFIHAVPFFFDSHGWCREERRRNCTVRFQEKGARVER